MKPLLGGRRHACSIVVEDLGAVGKQIEAVRDRRAGIPPKRSVPLVAAFAPFRPDPFPLYFA